MAKRFYTLAEYNAINAEQLNKPFEDEWSRNIIYNIIQKFTGAQIKDLGITKGECYYDLQMTLANGDIYVIEVKYRSVDSKRYTTHLINDEKFQSFKKAVLNKKVTNGIVCSIWCDGVIWLSFMGAAHTKEWHMQNKTTKVSKATDGKKVWKLCHMFNPEQIFYVCAEYDGENWKPYISKNPIDVNMLNSASYKLF